MKKKPFPVAFTFDVDGETLWTSRDPEHAKRPIQLSMGSYGLIEGVPRILRFLEKYNLKASFFIPGLTCERYPDKVKAIDAAGHDIGNHGYTHTHPHRFTEKAGEKEELVKSAEIIQKLTGKYPIGYRSPAWEFSANTVDILEEIGIAWSSNMMSSDQMTYLKVFDKQSKIVDIPVSWMLDDAAYWLYSVNLPGKAMQPLNAVEEYWKAEFDVMYKEYMEDTTGDRKNVCYMLTCHPQVIGRPARMQLLENVCRHILAYPNVEVLTCGELCTRFKQDNPL